MMICHNMKLKNCKVKLDSYYIWDQEDFIIKFKKGCQIDVLPLLTGVNRGEIKALRLIRNFIFIFTLLILKRVLTIYYHEIK